MGLFMDENKFELILALTKEYYLFEKIFILKSKIRLESTVVNTILEK